MNETHDTHDLEHVWPPYGVQLAQPEVRTFPDRMLVWCSRLEQRIEALEADNAALRQRAQSLAQLEAEIAALKTDLRDARTQTRVMLDQWHDMENQRNAAAERAGIAEAALRERVRRLEYVEVAE